MAGKKKTKNGKYKLTIFQPNTPMANKHLQEAREEILDLMNKAAGTEAMAKYNIGKIVDQVMSDESKYGKQAVESLAKSIGASARTFYRYAEVARAFTEEEVKDLLLREDCFGKHMGWMHLHALTDVSPQKRQEWITKVLSEGLTTDELATSVAAEKPERVARRHEASELASSTPTKVVTIEKPILLPALPITVHAVVGRARDDVHDAGEQGSEDRTVLPAHEIGHSMQTLKAEADAFIDSARSHEDMVIRRLKDRPLQVDLDELEDAQRALHSLKLVVQRAQDLIEPLDKFLKERLRPADSIGSALVKYQPPAS